MYADSPRTAGGRGGAGRGGRVWSTDRPRRDPSACQPVWSWGPGRPESGRMGNRPAKVLQKQMPSRGQEGTEGTPGSKDVPGREVSPLRTRHAERQAVLQGPPGRGRCSPPQSTLPPLLWVLPFYPPGVRKTETPVPLDSGGLTRGGRFNFRLLLGSHLHPLPPPKTCHPMILESFTGNGY